MVNFICLLIIIHSPYRPAFVFEFYILGYACPSELTVFTFSFNMAEAVPPLIFFLGMDSQLSESTLSLSSSSEYCS